MQLSRHKLLALAPTKGVRTLCCYLGTKELEKFCIAVMLHKLGTSALNEATLLLAVQRGSSIKVAT